MLIIIALALYFLLNTWIDFSRLTAVDYLKTTLGSFGIAAPFIFIIIMAISIVVSPIPSLPLAAASGILWGPWLGTLYSAIGAEIGALTSFIIARNLGKAAVEKMLKKEFAEAKITQKGLFILVFAARLFPFFQFDVVSYGAGLTSMKLRNFGIATFLGMLPMTFVFASLGESFFAGKLITVIATLGIIIAMFAVPFFVNKNKLGRFRNNPSMSRAKKQKHYQKP